MSLNFFLFCESVLCPVDTESVSAHLLELLIQRL